MNITLPDGSIRELKKGSTGLDLANDIGPGLAKAAIACGADGLMIEVHPDPSKAMSDGAQSLKPEIFKQLMSELQVFADAVQREF